MIVAFIIHFFWAILFFWLDIPILGFFNIASFLLYICGYYINKRGHTLVALYIGHIEIIIHAAVAVSILGSGSGFQYYLLHTIILTFIASKPRIILKSFIVFAYTTIYAVLSLRFKPASMQMDSVILDSLHLMNIVFVCFTLAFLTYLFRKVTDSAEENLIKLNTKLEVLANTDALTNLLNRRSMLTKMNEQEKLFKKNQKPFTLILTDIDNFKSINDTFGHDCGDMVLKECAGFLKDFFKDYHVARWGGEEFLILLQETDRKEAYLIVEELRERFEQRISFCYQGNNIKISLTYGLTEYNDATLDIFECINNADKALMTGKNQGKNCVVVQ